ncbi:MAG: FeoA family protein [Alphaproteobacteria bacterium]
MKLHQLAKGQRGRIVEVGAAGDDLADKLRELGLTEGDEVELVAHGPIGGQPIAVRLNRTLIALRRAEAEAVSVALDP